MKFNPLNYDRHTGAHQYWLPNGVTVSVIVDPHRPLRFEALVDGEQEPTPGLTTNEVEELLVDLAARPPFDGWEPAATTNQPST